MLGVGGTSGDLELACRFNTSLGQHVAVRLRFDAPARDCGSFVVMPPAPAAAAGAAAYELGDEFADSSAGAAAAAGGGEGASGAAAAAAGAAPTVVARFCFAAAAPGVADVRVSHDGAASFVLFNVGRSTVPGSAWTLSVTAAADGTAATVIATRPEVGLSAAAAAAVAAATPTLALL